MDETYDEKIRQAAERTEILRPPKQNLYTFGTTNVYYYLVTEAAYSELTGGPTETVVREGRVVAQKPRIVTPYYLTSLEGFSTDARRYFESLVQAYGRNAPGLLYSYRNEPKELNISSDNLLAVVDKLNSRIDERGDPLAAIVRGLDELWDVSLIKFIYELTRRSAPDNVNEMGARGLLDTDSSGVPAAARLGIEETFRRVKRGEIDPKELKTELDRWGLFEQYEDRFFQLFRK